MEKLNIDVMDVHIFDQKGNLLTSMEYLQRVSILVEEGNPYASVEFNNAVLDFKLLSLVNGNESKNNKSDFDSFTKNFTISFKEFGKVNDTPEFYKVVMKGVLKDLDTDKYDYRTTIIAEKVELTRDFTLDFINGEYTNPNFKMKLHPVDQEFFKLQLTEK